RAKVVEIVNQLRCTGRLSLRLSSSRLWTPAAKRHRAPCRSRVARMGGFREMHHSTDWAQIVRRCEGCSKELFQELRGHLLPVSDKSNPTSTLVPSSWRGRL